MFLQEHSHAHKRTYVNIRTHRNCQCCNQLARIGDLSAHCSTQRAEESQEMKAAKRKKVGIAPVELRGINPRRSANPRVNTSRVDFGTYHHSTPEESNEIRQRAEK